MARQLRGSKVSKVRSALFALLAVAGVGVGTAEAGGPRSIKDDPASGIVWSGFYAGIQGGYGWGDTEHSNSISSFGAFDANGGLIGATWGTNWQGGNWVYGVESDFSFSSMDGLYKESPCGVLNCLTDIRNLGTTRLRLGYATNTSLAYVTGGLAYGKVHAGDRHFLFDLSHGDDKTRFGWTLGAGIEWAFAPRWSLKAEYLHVDLGERQGYNSFIMGGDIDVRLTADIARVGVNYNFGPDFWSGVLGGR